MQYLHEIIEKIVRKKISSSLSFQSAKSQMQILSMSVFQFIFIFKKDNLFFLFQIP